MAIHAPITGAPPRAIQLPPILAFIMGLPVAPRIAVERTIQAAIDALDQIDGDADTEDADPDLEPDEDGGPAWVEWHTRGRHKLDRFGEEVLVRLPHGSIACEDVEDSDPVEDEDTDENDDPAEEDDRPEPDDADEEAHQPPVTACAAGNDL